MLKGVNLSSSSLKENQVVSPSTEKTEIAIQSGGPTSAVTLSRKGAKAS